MTMLKYTILIVIFFFPFLTLSGAQQIFVDSSSTGANDGSSWPDAYQDLQSALEDTDVGVKPIWIATGTYIPSQTYTVGGELGGKFGQDVRDDGDSLSADDLNSLKTFNLPDNVFLYGGFISGDDDLSDADPEVNPTILSGDLNGDDVRKNPLCNEPNQDPCPAGDLYTPVSKVDNVWHVVTLGDDVSNVPNAPIPMTANLNGLTISDGNAQGPNNFPSYFHAWGSAIYAEGTHNLTLSMMSFENNIANNLGTIYVSDDFNPGEGFRTGSLLVSDSTFQQNGRNGINAWFMSNVTVLRSEFMSNSSEAGTGMFILYTDTISVGDETVFSGGVTTGGSGSGIYVLNSGDVTIDGSTFKDGHSLDDGAIDIRRSGEVIIRNSLFEDNIADGPFGSGGAIHSLANESLLVENSNFLRNKAVITGVGGAINALGIFEFPLRATVVIQDNYFEGNGSRGGYGDTGAGGAIQARAINGLDISYNRFYKNDSSIGGAVSAEFSENINIHGNDFDMNSARHGGAYYNSLTISNSITNNSFTQNNSTRRGGAISLCASEITVFEDNQFETNSSKKGNDIAANPKDFDLISPFSKLLESLLDLGNEFDNDKHTEMFHSNGSGEGLDNGQARGSCDRRDIFGSVN